MKKSTFFFTNLFVAAPRAAILFTILAIILQMPNTEALVISLICYAHDVNNQTTIDFMEHKINELEKKSKQQNNVTTN